MDATLKLWAVIAIVGTLNYLSRLSFIALFANRHVPPLLGRAFRYVPAAMLTATALRGTDRLAFLERPAAADWVECGARHTYAAWAVWRGCGLV